MSRAITHHGFWINGIDPDDVKFEVQADGIALHVYLDEQRSSIRVDLRPEYAHYREWNALGLRALAKAAIQAAQHIEQLHPEATAACLICGEYRDAGGECSCTPLPGMA